jgi:hypothetical protein
MGSMDHYLKAIRRQSRIERTHEALLKLPSLVVMVLVWFAGTMFLGLCAAAIYLCWLLLQAVA